jgi:hypothetical protein
MKLKLEKISHSSPHFETPNIKIQWYDNDKNLSLCKIEEATP